LELELWTHVTDAREAERQRAELAEALGILRAAGARVLSTDVESTEPLAAGTVRGGAFARLGIGLFGARYGGGPKELRCALRMEARVMRCFAAKGQFVGYGLARAPESGYLVILRCGYGDGLFRMTGTERGIIAMGMQYTTLWRRNPIDVQSVPILDADTDLDDFARAAGVTPHEIVLRLGAAARSRGYEG
jgi:alanine racemase